MNENHNSNEKICAFYVSDYHFEMISLPYIIKSMESKKEVVILTENNLEKSIKTVVSKMILKEEKKNKILEINWTNNDENKFKKIKKDITENIDIVIFIKGKEKYIKDANKKIEKLMKNNSNIELIDCYNLEEINENMNIISDNYKNVLNTDGKKEIHKI